MLSQRLGSDTQKDPRFIDEFVAAVHRHPGCCDEVWLATDYGFPPLSVHKASAENLASAAEKLRKIGMRVSLRFPTAWGTGSIWRRAIAPDWCTTDLRSSIWWDRTAR